MSALWIAQNKDVSFAYNFAFDDMPLARSLISTKKQRGTNIDLWRIPSLTPVHEESCPFKVNLCFLSFKKSDKTLSILPEMPFCFSLRIIPLCQTLSNTFEMSRKAPLTSNPPLKDLHISWVIDKSWLMQESSGLKPGWFTEIKLFSIRNLNISLNISLSSIFPQIRSN